MAAWHGWWEQLSLGRQAMRDLVLNIDESGNVTGHGEDCIGPFTFSGTMSPSVVMLKEYLGRHGVLYVGTNTGEGIFGTWKLPGTPPVPGVSMGRFALFPRRDSSTEALAVTQLQPVSGRPYLPSEHQSKL